MHLYLIIIINIILQTPGGAGQEFQEGGSTRNGLKSLACPILHALLPDIAINDSEWECYSFWIMLEIVQSWSVPSGFAFVFDQPL